MRTSLLSSEKVKGDLELVIIRQINYVVMNILVMALMFVYMQTYISYMILNIVYMLHNCMWRKIFEKIVLFIVSQGSTSKSFYFTSYGFFQLQNNMFYTCVCNVWHTSKVMLKFSDNVVYEIVPIFCLLDIWEWSFSWSWKLMKKRFCLGTPVSKDKWGAWQQAGMICEK